jgi:hypothetical protein
MTQQPLPVGTTDANVLRTFMLPAPLWSAAKAKAAGEGRSMSEVLRAALRDYVAGDAP